jgi:hypothetical protein
LTVERIRSVRVVLVLVLPLRSPTVRLVRLVRVIGVDPTRVAMAMFARSRLAILATTSALLVRRPSERVRNRTG